MTDADEKADRVSVRTYVPEYQRDEWDEHADELDMSRSEFVRCMVQAGRRGFFDDAAPDGETGSPASERSGSTEREAEDSSRDDDPAGEGLETRIIEALRAEGYRSWDELLAAMTEDIEERLEATLQELQAADEVRYSGRNGGYTLDE